MKIFDCSNSQKSLRDKGALYGPKENDILRYLKQYASEFGHVFVDSADVVFTNDIFPESFPGKRKVKRMDGVFSRADVVHRNEALNAAAMEADHVIFISEYSRESYFRLYDETRETITSFSVITNEVDPSIFYPGLDWTISSFYPEPKEVIAVASDWSRPEKRLEDLLVLAEIAPNVEFVLVGVLGKRKLPSNVRLKGYLATPKDLADALRMSDAMISLFYKDAYPKTMVQAKYCGLPVLYAASGGQIKMGVAGVPVPDTTGPQWFSFDKEVPRLKTKDLEEAWLDFQISFRKTKPAAMQYRGRNDFTKMLRGYFKAMMG